MRTRRLRARRRCAFAAGCLLLALLSAVVTVNLVGPWNPMAAP